MWLQSQKFFKYYCQTYTKSQTTHRKRTRVKKNNKCKCYMHGLFANDFSLSCSLYRYYSAQCYRIDGIQMTKLPSMFLVNVSTSNKNKKRYTNDTEATKNKIQKQQQQQQCNSKHASVPRFLFNTIPVFHVFQLTTLNFF